MIHVELAQHSKKEWARCVEEEQQAYLRFCSPWGAYFVESYLVISLAVVMQDKRNKKIDNLFRYIDWIAKVVALPFFAVDHPLDYIDIAGHSRHLCSIDSVI